jgi:hypothetical protein
VLEVEKIDTIMHFAAQTCVKPRVWAVARRSFVCRAKTRFAL